jgi:hypothetical protein
LGGRGCRRGGLWPVTLRPLERLEELLALACSHVSFLRPAAAALSDALRAAPWVCASGVNSNRRGAACRRQANIPQWMAQVKVLTRRRVARLFRRASCGRDGHVFLDMPRPSATIVKAKGLCANQAEVGASRAERRARGVSALFFRAEESGAVFSQARVFAASFERGKSPLSPERYEWARVNPSS